MRSINDQDDNKTPSIGFEEDDEEESKEQNNHNLKLS